MDEGKQFRPGTGGATEDWSTFMGGGRYSTKGIAQRHVRTHLETRRGYSPITHEVKYQENEDRSFTPLWRLK
jgi:hypothetical protein